LKDRLSGKIALITGGGGGIGSATAKLFCDAGARVALIDADDEAAQDAASRIRHEVAGADVRAFVADLSHEQEAGRVVAQITSAFGSLDVLVNNAGIRRYEAIKDAPWDTWDAIVRVNLLSFVSMARAVLPVMRGKKSGSIVNVSSTYALYGRKGMGAYDATKAAVLSLTRTLAFEEAEHGIRVNAICPGFTRTPFHIKRMGQQAVDGLVPPCALQRWADPTELAYPILWLASDEASYVTSATFMIDGGLPV
jgi:NAD(P)-dependent dehydrogenase (short-subunit alcohol dehydrogenase family)